MTEQTNDNEHDRLKKAIIAWFEKRGDVTIVEVGDTNGFTFRLNERIGIVGIFFFVNNKPLKSIEETLPYLLEATTIMPMLYLLPRDVFPDSGHSVHEYTGAMSDTIIEYTQIAKILQTLNYGRFYTYRMIGDTVRIIPCRIENDNDTCENIIEDYPDGVLTDDYSLYPEVNDKASDYNRNIKKGAYRILRFDDPNWWKGQSHAQSKSYGVKAKARYCPTAQQTQEQRSQQYEQAQREAQEKERERQQRQQRTKRQYEQWWEEFLRYTQQQESASNYSRKSVARFGVSYERALEVFGIKSQVQASDLKRSFRELARSVHPDYNKADNATALFQELNEAYQLLCHVWYNE